MYKKAQLVSARLCFHFPSIVSMSFSLNRMKMYLFRQWLIKVALSFAFHLSLFSGFTEILPSLGPGPAIVFSSAPHSSSSLHHRSE